MKIALQVGLNVAYKRGVDSYYKNVIDGLAEKPGANDYRVFSHFF